MDADLRELRTSRQLPAKEIVSVVQKLYPKYDKTMQSKCERGNEYGIQLRNDAMNALLMKFAPDKLSEDKSAIQTPQDDSSKATKDKNDGHRLTCRISCRLEDDEYKALKEFVKAEGFDTMQAWLTHRVRQYIRRKTASTNNSITERSKTT
ncbi:MAG: hypothetical protein K0R50_439 [Eubacterium sp.]|nr:hypothetical protein [Eubacterium sp.]